LYANRPHHVPQKRNAQEGLASAKWIVRPAPEQEHQKSLRPYAPAASARRSRSRLIQP
jgi:hypothetical protein